MALNGVHFLFQTVLMDSGALNRKRHYPEHTAYPKRTYVLKVNVKKALSLEMQNDNDDLQPLVWLVILLHCLWSGETDQCHVIAQKKSSVPGWVSPERIDVVDLSLANRQSVKSPTTLRESLECVSLNNLFDNLMGTWIDNTRKDLGMLIVLQEIQYKKLELGLT